MGYRLKNGREAVKDEMIGHSMTRRTDEIMEQVWMLVCTDRRFNTQIVTKEVKTWRRHELWLHVLM